jgi:hypothetical protein
MCGEDATGVSSLRRPSVCRHGYRNDLSVMVLQSSCRTDPPRHLAPAAPAAIGRRMAARTARSFTAAGALSRGDTALVRYRMVQRGVSYEQLHAEGHLVASRGRAAETSNAPTGEQGTTSAVGTELCGAWAVEPMDCLVHVSLVLEVNTTDPHELGGFRR